jgi:hypothetical protein
MRIRVQSQDAARAAGPTTTFAHRVNDSARPCRLSEELEALAARFGERPVRLREVIAVLRGRAYTVLVLLLALPFCTPLPLVGLSTPFGAMIALIGFRLMLNQKPWLPRRLLDTNLPAGFFARLLRLARWLLRILEAVLRPRWSGPVDSRIFGYGYGAMILVCGFFLLLPLPIPLTNGLPALTIVLLAGAILERDGVCMIAGLILFAVTLCFFTVLTWGGAEAVGWLREWFGRTADSE